MLLFTRNWHAAAAMEIPRVITLSTTETFTELPVNILSDWVRHVKNVPNLLPVEVLILLAMIFWITFKVIYMLYKSRKQQTARTRLFLEIGNESFNMLFPLMDLAHAVRYYRFVINRPEITFALNRTNFSTYLTVNKGIMLSNTALNLPISFPGKISVPYWQRKRLSKLLCNRHYACILMVAGVDFSEMELIVLRTFLENDLYPSLE